MAKAPGFAPVKSRLQPPLTADEARALATAFLLDRLDAVAALADAAAVLAFAPAEAAAVLRTLIPPGVRLLAQRGDDLGARLTHVFDDLLAQHAAVLVLDADSPTLPMTWVADWPAFSRSSNGLNLAKITPALLALVKVAPEKPAKATA